jgi:hypothetical protein
MTVPAAPESAVGLRTAHRIMVTLVDTLTASSDLIALMARLLGDEGARPLQTQPEWTRYLEAKRKLESVHEDMHRFAEAAMAQVARENAEAEPEPAPGATADPADRPGREEP